MSQPRCSSVGQQLQQVRLRAGDAGDLLDVEDDHRCATSSTSSAQWPTEWRSSTARAQLDARARSGRCPQAYAACAASSSASSRAKRSSGGSTSSKPRVRREHRHARRGRLVDDLVERALAHVVHEHVLAREQRGNLGVRAPGSLAPARRAPSSRARSARSSSVNDGPRSSRSTSASCSRPRDRLEPFAGEVRPSASTRSRPAGSRRDAGEALECRSRGRSRRPSRESSGNERRSTVSTAVETRSASTSVR